MLREEVHDVVVVGAGIGGLAAATALAVAGCDTVCLEARDRVGGRTLSTPVPGGVLDLGATWFWDGEQRIAELIARLGVETFDQYLAGDTVLEEATGVRRIPGNLVDVPARRFMTGADALARGLAAALPADSLRLGTPVVAIRRSDKGDSGALDVHMADAVLHAEHVVLAVPPALALARIDFGAGLPAPLVRLARMTPVWMGAVAKVVALYPGTFWREMSLAGAAISRTGPLRELHDISGPGGHPAVLFGFAPAQLTGPGFEDAALSQLGRLFGPKAAEPESLWVQDWSDEHWTSPPSVHRLADYSLFGHALYQQPALGGRLHWASTETAAGYAGHIEGALAAAERAVHALLPPSPARIVPDRGIWPTRTRGR